jgi:hypothetical protein
MTVSNRIFLTTSFSYFVKNITQVVLKFAPLLELRIWPMSSCPALNTALLGDDHYWTCCFYWYVLRIFAYYRMKKKYLQPMEIKYLIGSVRWMLLPCTVNVTSSLVKWKTFTHQLRCVLENRNILGRSIASERYYIDSRQTIINNTKMILRTSIGSYRRIRCSTGRGAERSAGFRSIRLHLFN